MAAKNKTPWPPAPPDFTDDVIRAVMRAEATRMQTGRTRSAAFGQNYIYGGMFPILVGGWPK